MPAKAKFSEPAFLEDSPQWYKDAVIYEVHVRAFCDGNSDGIGDFPGLTQKLDYLQDLGITALWLLPFYPSPLRDAADHALLARPRCGRLPSRCHPVSVRMGGHRQRQSAGDARHPQSHASL